MSEYRMQVRRDVLSALGRMLYGPRYATSLAEALARHTTNKVAPSHVVMWVKGPRSIPEWVDDAALRVAEEGLVELHDRTRGIRILLTGYWQRDRDSLPQPD
ncbi:hypothetical protein SAMN05216360_103103 [Methylobacterium phyllostachyos]|uniref:Uncharacterized protein n=1 Tax=Methylobacterium phyllostachyos TaxID=582672 RepID=A0A1G9V8J5_9HYPH|nr:hypothetical protein [Methylobacterium phyllostachyos]SDM68413.1 hypothetical protein SAMN05216360_103103 [Methylobacterium phyllostachyos]